MCGDSDKPDTSDSAEVHLRKIILLLILIFSGYIIYSRYYSDKALIRRLTDEAVSAYEVGNFKRLRPLIWDEWADKDELLHKGQDFFEEFGPFEVNIIKRITGIDGDKASVAIAALIKSNFPYLGVLEGSQTAGVQFVRTDNPGYRGWRVSRVIPGDLN